MSSGSESDEDYVPGEPEQLSEEGSADEETDLQYGKELEQKSKKRKAALQRKPRKKGKINNGHNESVNEEKEVNNVSEEIVNPVEEKKREDDLWAKFLEGTDTKPKVVVKESSSIVKEPSKSQIVTSKNKEESTKNCKNRDGDEKSREKRIFEFAGETIVVENNIIKEKIKSTDTTAIAKQGSSFPIRGSSGLSSVLNNLNKKNKLSTLEKTKLDWDTYKQEEGVEEEIQSHNKGKGGYLDRQDFLERADHRQYEIERDLRMSRRSNR